MSRAFNHTIWSELHGFVLDTFYSPLGQNLIPMEWHVPSRKFLKVAVAKLIFNAHFGYFPADFIHFRLG